MKITGIPLRVPKSKKKMVNLNINIYRNLHYQINNKIKKYVQKLIIEKCNGKLCPEPPLEFIYTIYRPTKRKIDLTNVACIVDKFVADGIVKAGLIPNDNIDFVKKVTYLDGGIDRINPRCDLEIIKYKKKEKGMSVGFFECEICEKSKYEEFCKERIISGDYLYVCDNCMDKMQVECFAEYDDNYEDYSDEIKEYIDEYGEYYEYTDSGRQTEIERLNKKIGYLKTRRDSLMKNKNGENK